MGLLKVNGLAKSFGVDELFHDVGFEVGRGDKVGFVGANGAGKTTLMRCLLGQEETDGGTIQLDEAATIGYVEQQTNEKLDRLSLSAAADGNVSIDYVLQPQKFERIRRITGYLVGTIDRWNNAKRAEEHDRVKHGMH